MTFDFERAAGYGLIRTPHDPSYLPPPFVMSYATGVHYLQPNYDAVRSQFLLPDSRGFVCPSRTHAEDYLLESFDAYPVGHFTGAGTGWVNSNSGTGDSFIISSSIGDPAVQGPAIDLHTGASTNSRAGFTQQLGTVGDNFSYFAMPRFNATSADPMNAFAIWMQNNAGVTLQSRFYNGKVEVYADGQYRSVLGSIPSFGGDFFAECWCCVVKKANGKHDVSFLGGTKLYATLSDVTLPTYGMAANNTIAFTQLGLNNAMLRSQLAGINAGPSQLPDDMNLCGTTMVPKFSPSVGHMVATVENVSHSTLTQDNLKLRLTKNDGTDWTDIDWTNYGEVCKGVMDNTESIYRIAGSVALPNNGGTNLRFGIRSYGGVMVPVHGVTVFWDP